MIKRISLFCLIILVSHFLFSNEFEAGLKLEAQGLLPEALDKYNNYINVSLNNSDQQDIIEKIIYASTLYNNIEESIVFLINKAKKMKASNSRSIIYKKIAELYELTGRIFNAGIYYEKAAFVNKNNINYTMLLNSYDMLLEVGYSQKVNNALEKIDLEKLKNEDLNKFYILKARIFILFGQDKIAEDKLFMTSPDNFLAKFILEKKKVDFYLDKQSLYYGILYSNLELKTPENYNNLQPVQIQLNNKKYKMDNKKIILGSYDKIPPGIINVLEQMELHWRYEEKLLYIITNNTEVTVKILKKAGIDYEDIR